MMHQPSDRIVIVDGEPVMAEMLSDRLQFAGFENVDFYTDPHRALTVIRGNTRPAVVISAFNMPGMDGVALLTELKQHHPDLNAVIITSLTSMALRKTSPYAVLEKNDSLHVSLVSHVRRVLLSHLDLLLPTCPLCNESPACPLYEARRLSRPELTTWKIGLKPAGIQAIIRAHAICANTTIES
jgi:CheY-like chemotaxis protein